MNLKKITAIIVTLAMILSLASFTAFADDAPTLKVYTELSANSAKAGDTIDVKLYVTNLDGSNVKVATFGFGFIVDDSVFDVAALEQLNEDYEYVNITTTYGSPGYNPYTKFVNTSELTYTNKTLTSSTPVLTATLKVKDDAEAGDVIIDVDGCAAMRMDSVSFVITEVDSTLTIVDSLTVTEAALTDSDFPTSYEIGTDILAELADADITVSNGADKSEAGYKATWAAPVGFDNTVPGTYTFTGVVIPDEAKNASWDGNLEVTATVTLTAIADGTLAEVAPIEIAATEVDEDVVVEAFDLAITKGDFEDVIAITDGMLAVDNATIDTTLVDTYEDVVTITIPANTVSKGGKFSVAEETVIKGAVNVVNEISPVITVSNVKTKPGNQVEVTVSLEKNSGFADLNIEIGYDSDVMTLVDAKSSSEVTGYFTPAENYAVNPYNMSWDNTGNITYNGVIATLTFDVSDDAPTGVYPITVDYYKGIDGNYVDGEDINYDENEKPIVFIYVNGGVAVASYMIGDVNDDKKINSKDATYLLRYLADWEDIGWVEQAMDVNGDNAINDNDAIHLLRYLAGWDVTLAQ